jgi:hypothetical protein
MNTLPEMSVVVLAAQLLFGGIMALVSNKRPVEPPALHPEERVKIVPVSVLAGVLFLTAMR